MKLVQRIVQVVTAPLHARDRTAVLDGFQSGQAAVTVACRLGLVRSGLAPVWRKLVRWTVVLLGFSLFAVTQYGIAFLITKWWWWFILALYVVLAVIAFTAARPTHAFIGWIVISPAVYYFFAGDLGKGLPPISFDRVAVPFMVLFLAMRLFSNRVRPRQLLLAEWVYVSFILFAGVNLILVRRETDTGLIGKYLDYIVLAGTLYFVGKASLKKMEHILWAVVALVVVGFTSAVALAIEAHTGYVWYSWIIGLRIPLTWDDIGLGRGQGLWNIPHVTQVFCAMTTFLAFHLAGWTKRSLVRVLCYISMAVMVLAIYLAYSRTGYTALMIMFLLMPLLARGARHRYWMLAAAAIVLLLVSTPLLLRNKEFQSRMFADTFSQRVAINQSNMSLIRHNLWTGVGYGRIPKTFDQYVANLMHRRGIDQDRRKLLRPNNPHNWHLQVLGEEGLIGGLLYYGAIAGFLVWMLGLRRRLPPDGILGANLVATIFVATVANLIVLNFYGGPKHPYPVYIFWLVFALMVRLGELHAEEQATEAPAARAPHLEEAAG